jgi:hypothetical protein
MPEGAMPSAKITRRRRGPQRWSRFSVRGRVGRDPGRNVDGWFLIDWRRRLVIVHSRGSRCRWALSLDAVAELVVARAGKLAAEERLGTGSGRG